MWNCEDLGPQQRRRISALGETIKGIARHILDVMIEAQR